MTEDVLTYEQYLAALPPERRDAVAAVWQLVRAHMPPGYVEEVGPKFLSFSAEGEWYVALANQKRYISLYLMPIYVYPELKARFDASGKKLKGGKSCVYFLKAEDLPLDAIAQIIGAHDAGSYHERVQQVRKESKRRRRAAG